jgi:hypothetical protein
MSLLRGVLLAGMFRKQRELNGMTNDEQRNTLIVALHNLSNQSIEHYQGMNDDTLAGVGAVLAFLRQSGIRNDNDLKKMSADDQRNTLIVELDGQTKLGGSTLQGMSNIELVLLGAGKPGPGSLNQGSFVRGVLLAGKFSTQHSLNTVTADNQRNTLIVELATHSNQTNLQSFNDFDLAGMGAALVFLRANGIRSDNDLKKMSVDDQRNTLIVEIEAQTQIGIAKLQGLTTMDLIRLALGVDPAIVFRAPPAPLHQPPALPFVFRIDSFEIQNQKADNDHSDSDWLSIIVTIGNPLTKDIRTLKTEPIHIEGNIKTGNIIAGAFASGPIDAADQDVVVINYVLTNLGSSQAEEQFAQAVKVTDKVVQVVGPIAGAAIGLFFAAPGQGAKIGEQIAAGLDKAIGVLSDVFDFLGIHIGPPNCNGEVLHDTLTFLPNELAQAVNQPASREYTGTQENARCGGAPRTKVNFIVRRL